MKQSAVEWLMEQVKLSSKETYNDLFESFEIAIQMEKGQIIDAATWGKDYELGEDYYNEIYVGEE